MSLLILASFLKIIDHFVVAETAKVATNTTTTTTTNTTTKATMVSKERIATY